MNVPQLCSQRKCFGRIFNDTVKYRIEFLKSWKKTVNTFESLQENAQNLKNDYSVLWNILLNFLYNKHMSLLFKKFFSRYKQYLNVFSRNEYIFILEDSNNVEEFKQRLFAPHFCTIPRIPSPQVTPVKSSEHPSVPLLCFVFRYRSI